MHEITTIIKEYMKEHGPLQTALFVEEVLEKAFGNKYRIKAFANGTYIVEQSKGKGLKNILPLWNGNGDNPCAIIA
jgi:hypothetical protein